MSEDVVCTSCRKPLVETGSTMFNCPSCGKFMAGRCYNCRDQSVTYICPECGFEGP
ncbi:MAG: DUF1610 domain-containing protein [Thermoplasmata archaeon]|nr:DUF1610 domain-containing protein [Thermoplasmata archaeon]